MTREEAKELLPIIQAFAEEKTIQVRPIGSNEWIDVTKKDNVKVDFTESTCNYRIKPESKYRPFKTHEECWNEMLKHQPFGWVKKNGSYINITLVSVGCNYNKDLKNYTFADNTPFGIKEE